MKVEYVKLSQLKVNEANPREIRKDKFHALVDSILVFPKMMQIRPTVIDKMFKALGGNQRLQAHKEIAKMDIATITDRLLGIADFTRKGENEQKELVAYWAEWLDNPVVPVIKASHLTEDEKRQFIIKDNVSYGTWDYDALSSKWDSGKLQDWGMDVWNENSTFEPAQDTPAQNDVKTEDEEPDFTDALPSELDGVSLEPDELPKLHGTDERPNDYVIITYAPADKEKLIQFFGIDPNCWNEKVCYTIDEILFMKEGGSNE